jgi:hypothetical protein
MKPYDELPWWCQLLDPWFGPPWYAEIEDFDAWLAVVRRHLAGRVDELTAARYQAEEIISHEDGPLTLDDENDGDENEPDAAGERPGGGP